MSYPIVEILNNNNFFLIKYSEQPQKTEEALNNIFLILRDELQYSKKEKEDAYFTIPAEEIYIELRKKATSFYENRDQTSINETRVTALYNKIFPKEQLFNKLPFNLNSIIFDYLGTYSSKIEELTDKSSDCEKYYLKNAKTLGYNGNNLAKARLHITQFAQRLSSFAEKSPILKQNLVFEQGKIDVKETFEKLNNLDQDSFFILLEEDSLYAPEYSFLLKKLFTFFRAKIEKEEINQNNKHNFNRLFSLAIKKNVSLEISEFWLKRGADVHYLDNWKSALYYAMMNNSKETAKHLIQEKFNLETRDVEGLTVLMHAVTKNNLEWCQFFIEEGANLYTKNKEKTVWDYLFTVNIYVKFQNLLTQKNSKSLHDTPQSIKEIENINHEICNLFLKNHIEFDEKERKEKSSTIYSLLEKAISHGYPSAVFELVKHVKISKENYDPLLTKILSPFYNNPFINKHDYHGKNQLEARVYEILKIIRKKEPELIKNGKYRSNSPIFQAVKIGSCLFAKEFLESGVEVDIRNHLNQTPLMIAAEKQHTELCTLLLKAGANPNLQCFKGYTPLLYAIKQGDIEIIKKLLEYGANPYLKERGFPSLQNNIQLNAFGLAKHFGYDVILQILEAGEKQKKEKS